ncbi:hypothetical protein [Terrisporobacter mayombei]|uniref:Transposase n=1 Tax=Terrisporobacter mayombei TaxID=1541 RepID=A0ABY9Q044_9FIRM|nr:hypothetical protein [Terrisporobacter mayombei]MCC3868465.1 hypothetical protein [Terrisporobacter mayombei]WMT80619.1 hypothetical protein TEMA_09400 [Terrisporobacter mayombei]
MKQIYREDEVSKVTITFATNQTEEQQNKVLKDFAQAAYNLCLYEYQRGLKNTNENQDNSGTTKST